jgi:hypothetical protein
MLTPQDGDDDDDDNGGSMLLMAVVVIVIVLTNGWHGSNPQFSAHPLFVHSELPQQRGLLERV